jgi:hypothetical protein
LSLKRTRVALGSPLMRSGNRTPVSVPTVSARAIPHVPGRNRDVLDCPGIHTLHSDGLLGLLFF